jgi:type II secretory pathway predicted ATPase ExeA
LYLEHWDLTEKPFENTPDPKFLFHSAQHEEGLSRLIYVVREGKGAGMLTGVYGCGKTLLGKALASELEKDIYRVAFLTNPRLDDIEMLRMIIHLLGSSEDVPVRKADILMRLEQMLAGNQRDGKRTVIVIDEAHIIDQLPIFEELRMLLNYQSDNRFLLTLLLIGQPELKGKVESIKQLEQRIAMRYHLAGLNAEESAQYIRHRLSVAGAKRSIIDDESVRLIHERSGGIPRRINQICDMSLLTGMSRSAEIVTTAVVQEAIESL